MNIPFREEIVMLAKLYAIRRSDRHVHKHNNALPVASALKTTSRISLHHRFLAIIDGDGETTPRYGDWICGIYSPAR